MGQKKEDKTTKKPKEKKKYIPKALFTYNKDEDERYDSILAQLDEQIRERTEREKMLPNWATSDYRDEDHNLFSSFKWRR